jgi:hypothetical protein
MHKFGRTYLDLNERSILELDTRLTPRAKQAAILMAAGSVQEGQAQVEAIQEKDSTLSQMCDILDAFADNPQTAWETMNSLRILYEFRHELPCGFLKQEPQTMTH